MLVPYILASQGLEQDVVRINDTGRPGLGMLKKKVEFYEIEVVNKKKNCVILAPSYIPNLRSYGTNAQGQDIVVMMGARVHAGCCRFFLRARFSGAACGGNYGEF